MFWKCLEILIITIPQWCMYVGGKTLVLLSMTISIICDLKKIYMKNIQHVTSVLNTSEHWLPLFQHFFVCCQFLECSPWNHVTDCGIARTGPPWNRRIKITSKSSCAQTEKKLLIFFLHSLTSLLELLLWREGRINSGTNQGNDYKSTDFHREAQCLSDAAHRTGHILTQWNRDDSFPWRRTIFCLFFCVYGELLLYFSYNGTVCPPWSCTVGLLLCSSTFVSVQI